MEAIGFAEAIATYCSIHGINIRSILDLLDKYDIDFRSALYSKRSDCCKFSSYSLGIKLSVKQTSNKIGVNYSRVG